MHLIYWGRPLEHLEVAKAKSDKGPVGCDALRWMEQYSVNLMFSKWRYLTGRSVVTMMSLKSKMEELRHVHKHLMMFVACFWNAAPGCFSSWCTHYNAACTARVHRSSRRYFLFQFGNHLKGINTLTTIWPPFHPWTLGCIIGQATSHFVLKFPAVLSKYKCVHVSMPSFAQ